MLRNVRKSALMLAWVFVAGCTQFEESRPPIVPRPVQNPNQNQLRPGTNMQQQGNTAFPQIQPTPYNNSSSNLNNRPGSPQPTPSPFNANNQTFNPQPPLSPMPNGAPYTPGTVPTGAPLGPTSSNAGYQNQYSTPLSPGQ